MKKAKLEPWVDPPVHPAAEILPMATKAEIVELTENIKKNGLFVPIDMYIDEFGQRFSLFALLPYHGLSQSRRSSSRFAVLKPSPVTHSR